MRYMMKVRLNWLLGGAYLTGILVGVINVFVTVPTDRIQQAWFAVAATLVLGSVALGLRRSTFGELERDSAPLSPDEARARYLEMGRGAKARLVVVYSCVATGAIFFGGWMTVALFSV